MVRNSSRKPSHRQSPKRDVYRILEREKKESSVFVTFEAWELPAHIRIWKIVIPKKKLTPEFERKAILARIKSLKKEWAERLLAQNSPLSKTQLSILLSLALEGPTDSQSELFRDRTILRGFFEEKVGEKTAVQEALTVLESEGLIKIGRPKGTGGSRRCDLTIVGLFTLLSAELPDVLKSFDEIALSHTAQIPLLFGNWKKFIKDKDEETFAEDDYEKKEKHGTSNYFKSGIIEYFKLPIHRCISAYNCLKDESPTEWSEQLLADDLTRHVVLPHLFPYIYKLFLPRFAENLDYPFPTEEAVSHWFKFITRYPSLKKYLHNELNRLELVNREFAQTIKKWKNMANRL